MLPSRKPGPSEFPLHSHASRSSFFLSVPPPLRPYTDHSGEIIRDSGVNPATRIRTLGLKVRGGEGKKLCSTMTPGTPRGINHPAFIVTSRRVGNLAAPRKRVINTSFLQVARGDVRWNENDGRARRERCVSGSGERHETNSTNLS